ncbi:MAG: hypothetical protein A3G24_27805 [Betaproteobacteria bacterium RIFCSPLOWO2_12_FULL_62_13]|nr:MAG: hypothetical protein A3G24_27805 [Betaproteobacteria bacterium RIFCSPLOWO2_12_FULL_62_13]
MTSEHYWSTSDGTRLFYRYDDFTEYERMRRYVRDCTFVAFPGASHSMSAEIPDRCAQEYASFLKSAA